MRIGILGTRGIPNHYGGFEQFAQYLSVGLVKKGHEVFVYNSMNHPYEDSSYEGVNIIHCSDPQQWLGTAAQFIYDRNCLLDSQERGFDILLHLGYTSDSLFHRLWNDGTVHAVNMDGLEWKRSKYNRLTKLFLKKAESWAIKHADLLIADSKGIQEYLSRQHNSSSSFIPYGATPFVSADINRISTFHVDPFSYGLLIARMEPENNIEMIIKGYLRAELAHPLLIIGNTSNRFGLKMISRYNNPNIRFLGGIYDMDTLNELRYHSGSYFHGHSAGGTNPSLLEAMACQCNILAHDNPFNRSVLGNEAGYFSSAEELTEELCNHRSEQSIRENKKVNLQKIIQQYNWEKIIDDYESVLMMAWQKKNQQVNFQHSSHQIP